MKPRRAPRKVEEVEVEMEVGLVRWGEERARAPRKTAKLKFGPGKAWISASPRRKLRGEIQPGSTT